MGTYTESITVTCAPGERPVDVRWNGQRFAVVSGRRRTVSCHELGANVAGQSASMQKIAAAFPRTVLESSGLGQPAYELWDLEISAPNSAQASAGHRISLAHQVNTPRWRLIRMGAGA